jgi:hypothetical protein
MVLVVLVGVAVGLGLLSSCATMDQVGRIANNEPTTAADVSKSYQQVLNEAQVYNALMAGLVAERQGGQLNDMAMTSAVNAQQHIYSALCVDITLLQSQVGAQGGVTQKQVDGLWKITRPPLNYFAVPGK